MLTQVQKLQLKNMTEQVLHVPGNYRGGILEMAMVLDCSMERDALEELVRETAGTLKRQGEVFRNVRLNTILWQSDESLVKEITPLPYLLMGTFFRNYVRFPDVKRLELLTAQLKVFYARSKLILVFTEGGYRVCDRTGLEESLKPFLGRKMIYVTCAGGQVEITRVSKALLQNRMKRREAMKFQFAHNNFNVTDLERSIRFYREALGLREQRRKEAHDGSFILVFMTDGTTPHSLELTWLRDWEKEKYDLGDNEFHLAFTVDDMEAAHSKHQEMGCICYENEAMGIYFISDPDGYWIEIIPD